MPSTYSTTLRLELPQNGEQSGIWGQTLNNDLTLIEQSIAGVTDLYLTGDVTMTNLNGLPDEARSVVISCTGSLSAPANVIAPPVEKTYIVTNNTGANVTMKTSTGNGVTVLNTTSALVYCDGTDFYQAVNLSSVSGNQTISGNEVILGNVTSSGNLIATNNISSYSAALTLTSNNSIITAASNTGGYVPPTGTTAQRPSSPTGGMTRFNTDLGVYEIYNGTIWQALTGAYSVNYVIVGGGGAGGSGTGGGGGGGGVLANATSVQPSTSYTVVVGAGGAPFGVNGSNSSAFSLTALGGGYGGTAGNGASGSSGGGGSGVDNSSTNGGSGTSGQGFNGGGGMGTNTLPGNYGGYAGGGGGGAGAAGSAGIGYPGDLGNGQGGSGGIGVQVSISGSTTYYGGGGGGAGSGYAGNNAGGSGGQGGGGNGGYYGSVNGSQTGTAGTANTGGGGGGSRYGEGTGGSGVVIISYPSPSQRGTGGTVTSYTSGGTLYWVHTFTTSGTYTA